MNITLYKVLDSANTVNKTLENGLTLDINLKSDTDITRPVIKLANIDGLMTGRFNYFHIPELNRYYFINNVTSINNSINELDCQIDLLMTYQTEIMASHARLRRNIRTGDYLKFTGDSEIFTTVSTIESDKAIEPETSNPILTTIGL